MKINLVTATEQEYMEAKKRYTFSEKINRGQNSAVTVDYDYGGHIVATRIATGGKDNIVHLVHEDILNEVKKSVFDISDEIEKKSLMFAPMEYVLDEILELMEYHYSGRHTYDDTKKDLRKLLNNLMHGDRTVMQVTKSFFQHVTNVFSSKIVKTDHTHLNGANSPKTQYYDRKGVLFAFTMDSRYYVSEPYLLSRI